MLNIDSANSLADNDYYYHLENIYIMSLLCKELIELCAYAMSGKQRPLRGKVYVHTTVLFTASCHRLHVYVTCLQR